jgi:hypothetical protein
MNVTIASFNSMCKKGATIPYINYVAQHHEEGGVRAFPVKYEPSSPRSSASPRSFLRFAAGRSSIIPVLTVRLPALREARPLSWLSFSLPLSLSCHTFTPPRVVLLSSMLLEVYTLHHLCLGHTCRGKPLRRLGILTSVSVHSLDFPSAQGSIYRRYVPLQDWASC